MVSDGIAPSELGIAVDSSANMSMISW